MSRKTIWTRLLVLCVSVTISLSMMPAAAFAEPTQDSSDQSVPEQVMQESPANADEQAEGEEGETSDNQNEIQENIIEENILTEQKGNQSNNSKSIDDPDPELDKDPASDNDGEENVGAGDENATTLNVTIDGEDVDGKQFSMAADRDVDLTIQATLPQTSGTKTISVNIPTGWVVIGYSAQDSDDDHSITISKNTMGVAVDAGAHIRVDEEYKDAIKNVVLEPNLDESIYGTVVSSKNTWETQSLDGWGTNQRAKTYGGKLTYTLSDNAANVKLVVRLRPQPFLYPRAVTTENIPPVDVTLSTQHSGEDPVVRTSSMNMSTTVPTIKLDNPVTNRNLNIIASEEGSKVHFGIRGIISQYSSATAARTSTSLADEYSFTVTYPEGVFFSEDQTGGYYPGTIENHPNPGENGGGYITMTGDHRVMTHNNNLYLLYFDARAGNGTDFHPDCERVYGKDKSPDSFKITGKGTVTRAGESKDVGPVTYTRNIYVGSGGGAYNITIDNVDITRRDLVKDFGMDDYDILLAQTGLTSKFSYVGVPFHFENEDNKLGITGIRVVGKQVRDIEITTFYADGSAGRTITLDGPYGESASAPAVGSHMIAGPEIGLEEGEYISEVYLKTDLSQQTYNHTYLSGGIGFIGQFLDSTPGKVNISVVEVDDDGEYTETVELNAETGKPIKGYAAVKPGLTVVGGGSCTTVVSKTPGGNHADVWYPNDVLYFRSTLSTASVRCTQNTHIDPTITVALPSGLELNTSSVQGRSAAGNHKSNEWFDLKLVGSRQIEEDGITWNCYDFTSVNPLDMIANEKSTNAGNYGGTVTSAEQQFSVRFNTIVTSTCPQYSLQTQKCVLWYLGGVPDGNVQSATSGESFIFTDTNNRMGHGTDAKAVIGKNDFVIKPLVGLGMDLAIRPVEDPEADWLTWAGGDNTVALVHEGRPAEVKLSYVSKSESEEFKDTVIYLPIPKKDASYEYLNNKELAAPVDVLDPASFEFTANLAGPITMVGDQTEWKTLYAVKAESNPVKYDTLEEDERDDWEPVIADWVTEDQVTDWSSVVMAKFIALDDILPGKTGQAVFTMDIDPDAQLGSYDYWRGYGKARLGQAANNWKYTPVIAATPTSATFLGQIFIDDDLNAAFEEDSEQGYGTNFTAVLSKDDGAVAPMDVTVDSDGSMKILDSEGRQIYLRMGDYTLTVTKSDDETVYDYEKVESDTPSSAGKWYNDIKNANISGTVATHKFTVDKSVEKTRNRAADKTKPIVYYAGVGIAKLNDFSFTKLGEVEGNDGSATNEPFADAEFALYTDAECTTPAERDGTVYEATSGDDGKVEFNDIVAGTYYMKETALPSGTEDTYFTNTTTYKVVVSNDSDVEITRTVVDPNTGDIEGNQEEGYSIINRQRTIFTGFKIWNDGDDKERPTEITIRVIADGAEATAQTVKVLFAGEPGDGEVLANEESDGSWSFTVTNLQKFADGAKITYTIAEEALKGYIASVEGDTITNTKVTEATVKKIWLDGDDASNRPESLKFDLYQKTGDEEQAVTVDGDAVSRTLPINGKWETTVTDLPKYDLEGNEITYFWKEPESINNYKLTDTDVDGTVTTFTNTLLKEITVKKEWAVPETKTNPDSVRVKLLNGNNEIDSAELSDNNSWKHTFTSNSDYILYAYDENGEPIEYTIEEDEVPNYTVEVSDPPATDKEGNETFTVTNTYSAEGTLALGGLKKLDVKSGKLTSGQFTFTVTDNGKEIATGTNDENGKITFNPATVTYKYDKDTDDTGDHTIVVRETGKDGNGVKADAEDVIVTVNVKDANDGSLTVTPDDITSSVEMTNTYETSGAITFSGTKTLNGGTLSANQFSFELYDSEGKLIDQVFNEADGRYSFSEIRFTGDDLDKDEEGNYVETTKTYRVIETKGTDSHITYDDTEYKITATLRDNGKGTIEVSTDQAEDSYDFINIYTPDKPGKPGKPDKPVKETKVKTGDETNIGLWLALLIVAVCGFAGTLVYRRRKNN